MAIACVGAPARERAGAYVGSHGADTIVQEGLTMFDIGYYRWVAENRQPRVESVDPRPTHQRQKPPDPPALHPQSSAAIRGPRIETSIWSAGLSVASAAGGVFAGVLDGGRLVAGGEHGQLGFQVGELGDLGTQLGEFGEHPVQFVR